MSFSGMEELKKSTYCHRGYHIKCKNREKNCGCECHLKYTEMSKKLAKVFENYRGHTERLSQ